MTTKPDGSEALSKVPFRTIVEAGRVYRWCSCGLSAKQPFCDESHRATARLPVMYKAPEDLTVALCGCKQTKQPPFCDGSHIYIETGGTGRDK